MQSRVVEILENIHIQDDAFKMVLPVGRMPKAGQFVMVKKQGSRYILPRAISVSNATDQAVHLVYQAVGRGTGELAELKAGDKVEVTGPIGHGFPLDEIMPGTKVALLGGGVGTAPMVYTAKKLKEKGIYCDAHIAFRYKSLLKEELSQFCNNVYVVTESGDEGVKGYVTETFSPSDYDLVFCCGPTPMMAVVVDICKKEGVDVYVSTEGRMGCGIGGCYVCTCRDKNGKAMRSCVDGPVFNGLEVDLNAKG